MLTKEEAKTIYDICTIWPGGLGCVLIPDYTAKRGFRTADWGWKGKKVGDFEYSHLSRFKDALLCPVTAIGVMRGAERFQDHMAAYRDINEALCSLLHRDYDEVKRIYNFLLSRYPLSLSCLFDNIAQNQPVKGMPIPSITSGYYAELYTSTRKGPIKVPVAILATDTNTVWTVDEIAFDREGKPKNKKMTGTIKEWK